MQGRKPYQRNFRGGGREERGPLSGKRAMFLKRSRETVMEALRSRDMLLGGVTRSMEDLDKIINLLGERLEDWYGIYFPELKTEDRLKYCEAVLAINREDLQEADIASVLGQKKASEVAAAARSSLGAKISPEDILQCHSLARTVISLGKLRKDYDAYQQKLAGEICPNMAAVGGADVAAKLVSHVGSLHKLALLPASTIQVLGAEKALFKHLRNRRVDPPKHGIIFQHARISASPKAVRGKIARALANKLALAAKADEFTKRDMRAELKADFDARFAEIMKEYERAKSRPPPAAKPPPVAAPHEHKHGSKPPAQHQRG